jgi:hypothetical protein
MELSFNEAKSAKKIIGGLARKTQREGRKKNMVKNYATLDRRNKTA